MKKLLLGILTLLCVCLAFAGCNNSSYEMVSSVEFVTDGKKQTLSSYASLVNEGQLYKHEYSSQSEYEKIDKKYRFSSFGVYFASVKLDKSRTISSFHGLTEDDYDAYIYWGEGMLLGETDKYLEYYKQKFYGWKYNYIYVKVINSKTIAIYDSDTDESNATTYTVTSYKITHFQY